MSFTDERNTTSQVALTIKETIIDMVFIISIETMGGAGGGRRRDKLGGKWFMFASVSLTNRMYGVQDWKI